MHTPTRRGRHTHFDIRFKKYCPSPFLAQPHKCTQTKHNSFLSLAHNGLHNIWSECQWHETKANELGWRLNINLPSAKRSRYGIWCTVPFRQSGVGFGKSQFSPDARGALLRQTGVYLEPACFLCIYFSTVLFRWPGNERTYKTLKSLMPHRVKRHVLLKLGLSYVPRTHCIYDFRKGSVAVGQVTRIPLGFRGFNVVIRCSIKAYLLPQVASIAPAQQYTYYPLLWAEAGQTKSLDVRIESISIRDRCGTQEICLPTFPNEILCWNPSNLYTVWQKKKKFNVICHVPTSVMLQAIIFF